MSQVALTEAIEHYLREIYKLAQERDDAVSITALARAQGVSPASASAMVKKLAALGLADHARYQGVELTPAGERIALEVIRHHRLLELYLAETLGYRWDQVHAEAERLEHHLSDELEARIDSTLGHPTRDPHGDPIPSPEGIVEPLAGCPIGSLPNGVPARITRVLERDSDRLRYLGDLGLYPGELITVV